MKEVDSSRATLKPNRSCTASWKNFHLNFEMTEARDASAEIGWAGCWLSGWLCENRSFNLGIFIRLRVSRLWVRKQYSLRKLLTNLRKTFQKTLKVELDVFYNLQYRA